MLFVLFVLILILVGKVWGLSQALWRIETEQQSSKTQLKAIRELIAGLVASEKECIPNESGSKPAEVPGKTEAPVPVPTPPVLSNVKIDLPKPVANNAMISKAQAPPPLPISVAPSAKEIPLIVANARDVLGRTWNWILWGQEERPADVSIEYALATTWLPRLAVTILTACGAWFLMGSYDEGFMGPTARVVLVMLVGAGMIVVGLRMRGNKYSVLGQALLGGGLLLLYLSIFTAGPREHLIPIVFAFALTFLVTTAAWLIAVRVNSMLVAVLGIAGGFLTPVLLSTGDGDLPILYSYILLLNLGILAVSRSRNWPLLNYLGFILTYVLYFGSLKHYGRSDFPLAISFLTAFFVIHSVIVYLYNIQRRRQSNALEIIHLVANACLYGFISYWLIRDAHGRPYPSIMSVGLALFYIGHVMVFLRRKLKDRGLLVALIALAGAFTTWTLPLVFEKESLTIGFALLAATMLWIGKRIGSRFMENISHALYLVVFARLFGELHSNFGRGSSAVGSEYWRALLDRLWTFGISIGAIGFAFWSERKTATQEPMVSSGSDTGRLIPRSVGRDVFYWSSIGFLFLFLHLEINAMFGMWDAFRLPALTVLWCCMGGYFLYAARRAPSIAILAALSLFAVASIMKVLGVDLLVWNFCDAGYYNIEYTGQAVFARFIDFGSILLLLGLIWRWLPAPYPKPARAVFGYAGLAFLFVYTSLELNSLLHWRLPAFEKGGLTSLWAVYAIAFTSCGIWRNIRPLRYSGLILFAIVAGKVFIHDLSGMPMIFRVIAFFVVGLALLLGSFAYVFANKKFEIVDKSGE